MPQTEQSSQTLPPWYEAILRELGEQSQRVAKSPYNPYQGPRIAPYGNPFINQSEQMIHGNIGQYAPYAGLSKQLLGEGTRQFPEIYQQYMNPYQQQIVENIGTLGNRNFLENIMPALEAHFVGLGQHGSTQHADLSRKAARDTQEAILREQQQALSHGYELAGNLYAGDRARLLEGAQVAGNLGRTHQVANLGEAAALRNIGEAQRDYRNQDIQIPYEEHLRQQAYPAQQVGEHAARLQGHPHSTQSTSHHIASPPPGPPQTNTAGRLGELAGSLLGARRAGIFKEGGHVPELARMTSQKHRKHKKSQPKSYFGVSGIKFNTGGSKSSHYNMRRGRL